ASNYLKSRISRFLKGPVNYENMAGFRALVLLFRMLHQTEIRSDEIADEWAIRSELWNSEIGNSKPKRRKRERNSAPLILCGHGVSLRIENGALAIRDGFTHYPQQQATCLYFRGDLDLPPRIVLLDGSGSLSFDVLSWLAEQGVTLARIKWSG